MGAKVEQGLTDQFMTGRVLASISSRPSQCGRSDGYVLEGKELEFYLRKIKAKKGIPGRGSQPVTVSYQVEGARLTQPPGTFAFRQHWLYEVLASKNKFVELVTF